MTGNNDGRYAAFLEARKGDQRAQWMLFPPLLDGYGLQDETLSLGSMRFIKRKMDRPGHRAKWGTTARSTPLEIEAKLKLELDQYESVGWQIMEPIVIELEADDYMKVWENKDSVVTPYKALRHVEAVAKTRGYRLTD